MNFTHVFPSRPRVLAGPAPAGRAWQRPREAPATAIPGPRDERGKTGTITSLLFHLLLLLLLLMPAAPHTDPNLKEIETGAGGPGPAGGGGGGTSGTGGIRYITVTPPPTPVVPPVTPPPVIEPPKLPDPVIPELKMPELAQPKMEVKIQSPIIGLGGGTGHDGTTGNGPGTGGGIGTGIGTGRGSGVGPGTGGGNQENYAPSPTEIFIPPLPLPAKVRGFHLIAIFDIDEKGKILDVVFNPTKDGDYNRKLSEILKSFKFRPGTTPQGVPVRAKFQLVYDLSG